MSNFYANVSRELLASLSAIIDIPSLLNNGKLDKLSEHAAQLVQTGLRATSIKADRIRLKQILTNFISNAVKYSKTQYSSLKYLTTATN